MRAIPAASAALLGVGALVMTAPAAQAHGDTSAFRAGVLPAVIAAGGQVTLRATGCEQSVTVSSAVFDTLTVPRGRTTARVRVDRDAEPGAVHKVSFYCGTFWQSVDLTVAGGRPVAADRPRRGVHAGEGGSRAGLNLKEIGLGAALVVASLGTAYHLSRQRADEDGGGT